MDHLGTMFTVSLGTYAVATGIYLISENRRPQATLAWMLAFILFPRIGLLTYVLVGRNRKVFARQSKLLRQDLEANAEPLVSPILSRQDAEIARLEADSASRKKLMMLVRRNSQAGIRIAPTSSLWRLHTISDRNHRKITVIDGAIGYTGVRDFLYEKGYLHAKTISIDSEICSIGSANIDIRSFSINYELNAVLYSRALAKELEEAFERDLAHCIEFDPKEYEHRSIASRFRDSVARLLSPLL